MEQEIAAATNARSCFRVLIRAPLFTLLISDTEWKAIIHCCLTIIEMNLN